MPRQRSVAEQIVTKLRQIAARNRARALPQPARMYRAHSVKLELPRKTSALDDPSPFRFVAPTRRHQKRV